MFRKLDLFPSSGEGGGEDTQLGPLERANLNHWTSEWLDEISLKIINKPHMEILNAALTDGESIGKTTYIG
jgi:hypothetical protein